MKTTRQRILEYIQSRKTASVDDLSQVLHFTRENIRHHLKQLLAEGLIIEVGKRSAIGRGRPSFLYSLSEQFTSHNLDKLASAVLDILFSEHPEPEIKDRHIKLIASTLSKTSSINGKNQLKRLLQAVRILNEMNYQARWEAHDDGPRVIFSHCPYAAILHNHPELCQMDVQLLEEMLGMPARLKARIKTGSSRFTHCIFTLEKPR
jgi:predicted ArsR family transcriptional regulator